MICERCGIDAIPAEGEACTYCRDTAEAPETPQADALLEESAKAIIEAVAAIEDPARLEALHAQESAGKARSTVLTAIDARTDELFKK